MNTLIRSIVILAAAVLLLSAAVAALLLSPVQPQNGTIAITACEPTDITSVTVSNESGFFRFFYDASEKGYALDDIPPHLTDLDAFVSFMSVCANLTALRSFSADDADVAGLGLDVPAAEVSINFFDGSSVNIKIGAKEQVSGGFYALASHSGGEAGIYIIAASSVRQFLLPKTQIISTYIIPPISLTSPLSAIGDITFTGGKLDRPVSIYRTSGADIDIKLAAMSFGAPTHIIRGMTAYGLDQTYGAEIFGSLLGLRGEIAEYNLSGDEKAIYGFDNPYMTVSFDMYADAAAAPSRLVLQITEAGDGNFYASLEGSGAVYLIGREPFIDIDYSKLPVRWFLTPLLPDLSSVTIESPDAVYKFGIDNNDSRNPVITYNGQTLSAELFRSFFRLITSAAHDGTYPGPLPPPAGPPLLAVTYEYINSDKPPDTLALYPGDPQRLSVYINNFGEFAMKDLFVRRVLEGAENLISGKTIEENWQ